MAPTQQQIFARRRGLALLGILLTALAIWAFSGLGLEQNTEPTAIPTVDETTTAAPAEITDCPAGTILVEAKIGNEAGTKASFSSDEKPMIWYTITNTGPVDCNFNVGSRVTFFTITSGNETYWSSKDCDREQDVDQVVRLISNKPVEAQKGIWERVRSSGEGCGAEQQPVPAGGASYFLKVEVNGEYSQNSVQFLLN